MKKVRDKIIKHSNKSVAARKYLIIEQKYTVWKQHILMNV